MRGMSDYALWANPTYLLVSNNNNFCFAVRTIPQRLADLFALFNAQGLRSP